MQKLYFAYLKYKILSKALERIYYTLYNGGDKRNRTADLLNAIQALSRLSYTPSDLLHYISFLCIISIYILHKIIFYPLFNTHNLSRTIYTILRLYLNLQFCNSLSLLKTCFFTSIYVIINYILASKQ